MPFNSSVSLFSALSDGIVPALLGGTGKKPEISVDFFRWETFTHPSKYQLEVSELQSLITHQARLITDLECDRLKCKNTISYIASNINKDTISVLKAHYESLISQYRVKLSKVNEQLSKVRKIQTKLKRQRANRY